eukprot:g17693.t1
MRSLHHPWTLGLATGETSRTSFTNYVAQDAYFLKAFTKAYAYALTKAEDEESVRAFHSLIGSVLEELSLHSSYAAKWGVDLKNNPPPVQATTEYVNFLLTVASDPTSSVAQVLAAMVPCMRLYAFLGKELRQAFPGWKESVYAEWIETYSSSDFESAAVLVETLLDQYSTDAEYPSLLALYRKAMELEFAFFDSQIQGSTGDGKPKQVTRADTGRLESSSVPPRTGSEGASEYKRFRGVHQRVALLCVDFDDTLTDGDTTSLLIEAVKAQRDTAEDQATVERDWAMLTSAFLSKWSEVTEGSLTTEFEGGVCPVKSEEDVDRQGLEEMLRRLEAVDLDSVSRVSDSKILRGLTRESVRSSLAGPLRSSWKVRAGMARCMSRALASPFRTHVVSINWSRDVITTVLSETLLENDGSSSSSGTGDIIVADRSTSSRLQGDWRGSISSNDLVYDESGISSGEIAVQVSGSFGKHQRFLTLENAARDTFACSGPSTRSITIYVGDSVTDLLAMLDADVGIVVGDNDTFEKAADTFGIAVRPLSSAYGALDGTEEIRKQGTPARTGQCVYRVSQWAEIEVFLFGVE